MGKGSSPRPFEVDHQTFAKNFDGIFGKKTCPKCGSDKCSEKHFNDYDGWHSHKKCDACNHTWDHS